MDSTIPATVESAELGTCDSCGSAIDADRKAHIGKCWACENGLSRDRKVIPIRTDLDPIVLPDIPPFPWKQIDGPLRAFLDWGRLDGLHPECLAAAGLAALATLAGPARLSITTTRIVRPNVWIALIGIASSGKSPAYTQAFHGIETDRAEREHIKAQRREVEAEDYTPDDVPAYAVDDMTIEAVARWLLARGADPTGAIVTDELSSFLEGLTRYRRHGSDIPHWLKLWTGRPLDIQRVGDGGATNAVKLYVPEPVVSISGPLTPNNIGLLGREGSGFRPRWLPFLAPAKKPGLGEAGRHPTSWTTTIGALLGDRQPREWTLSSDALRAWQTAREQWAALEEGLEALDVLEALRKADTQCLRLAVLIAESLSPGAGGELPAAAMAMAIEITHYCLRVWRSLPKVGLALSGRDEKINSAVDQLAEWIDGRPERKATLRDIQRAHVAGIRSAAQQDMIVNEYLSVYGPDRLEIIQPENGGHVRKILHAPLRDTE